MIYALLILWGIVTCFYAIKFALIIIGTQEAVEESLDLLNDSYGKINEILQRPLFYDSVEVRRVLLEIKKSHNAVLLVANKLTSTELPNIEDDITD